MKSCYLLLLFFLFITIAMGSNLVCRNIRKDDKKCLNETIFFKGPKEHYDHKGKKGDIGQNGTKGEIGEPGSNGMKGFNGSKGQKGEEGQTTILNLATDKNCPGVTFHFPNFHQIDDYVRYRGYVPSMKEETICAWIELKKLNELNSIFSYATQVHSNALLFALKSNNTVEVTVNDNIGLFFNIPFSSISNQFHFCVWISSVQNTVAIFVNSIKANTTSKLFKSVNGRGSLVLGQDQDEMDAKDLDAEQSFNGNITNMMVWPRILSDQEIYSIATKCECPQDYSVAMTMDRSELYGEAYYSVPDECPTYKNNSFIND